jgi:cell division protein FtsB
MSERAVRLMPRFRIPPQLVVIILVLGLAGAMAIEPTRQLLAQRSRIAEMTSELRELNKSNRLLKRKMVRLQDPDYIEQQAREEIGLVRPGETSYIVVPPSKKGPGRHHRREAKPAAKPQVLEPSNLVIRMLHFLGID